MSSAISRSRCSATLFAITLTTQLIRLLGQAAIGKVLSEGVLALLAFSALNYLPVLLSLTLFITVLMTLSRSYRDSEMVIWFGSGLSLLAWMRPVLLFAAPLVVLVAVLSLFLSPWAIGKAEEYRHQMDTRDEITRVAPGVFREASSADRVFFVEEIAGDEINVQNVFIAQMSDGRLGIMVSRRGYREVAPNGDRFVVLLDGRRYEGVPGNLDFKVMDFERYAQRIEARERQVESASTKAMSTLALLQERGERASCGIALAHRLADFRARAGPARDSAVVRESARQPLGESAVRAAHLHGLRESPQHRAGLGFAGPACRFRSAGGSCTRHARPSRADVLPAASRRFADRGALNWTPCEPTSRAKYTRPPCSSSPLS